MMTPETRTELETKLAAHGLTVTLTRDYQEIMLQLARLAQLERRLARMGEYSPILRKALSHVRAEQDPSPSQPEPLDVLLVPAILAGVNRALASVRDRDGQICLERLGAATAAFVGILEARP